MARICIQLWMCNYSKSRKGFIILLICTFAVFTLYYDHDKRFIFNNRVFALSDGENRTKLVSVSETKYILLWTTFFGEVNYIPNATLGKGCLETNCVVTSDRKFYNKSGAVIFHWSDIGPYPSYRVPNQNWVLFVLESPHHTTNFGMFDKIMNLTATYRTDSDFFTAYDTFRILKGQELEKANESYSVNYAKGKSKMVAWFVSNCRTPSNREDYAAKLSKYIQVDIYGACGTKQCQPKMSTDCYRRVSNEYRFYLSFENSICRDYVTEKYFHILNTTMIPVVLGGANYSEIGPPNSFIDARNYPNPEDLAKYLLKVASDRDSYNSFFQWKKSFALKGKHWVCDLCSSLHRPDFAQINSKTASGGPLNLNKWWMIDAHCQTWKNGMFQSIKTL